MEYLERSWDTSSSRGSGHGTSQERRASFLSPLGARAPRVQGLGEETRRDWTCQKGAWMRDRMGHGVTSPGELLWTFTLASVSPLWSYFSLETKMMMIRRKKKRKILTSWNFSDDEIRQCPYHAWDQVPHKWRWLLSNLVRMLWNNIS